MNNVGQLNRVIPQVANGAAGVTSGEPSLYVKQPVVASMPQYQVGTATTITQTHAAATATHHGIATPTTPTRTRRMISNARTSSFSMASGK